nr:uncharacterized protein LOC128704477 [Cherax quadricarinatus]
MISDDTNDPKTTTTTTRVVLVMCVIVVLVSVMDCEALPDPQVSVPLVIQTPFLSINLTGLLPPIYVPPRGTQVSASYTLCSSKIICPVNQYVHPANTVHPPRPINPPSPMHPSSPSSPVHPPGSTHPPVVSHPHQDHFRNVLTG